MTLLCVCVAGCSSASLATDSGPGRPWSTDGQQMVHVGEHVDFSFVLTKGVLKRGPRDPVGAVDYCIARAGSEQIEADLDNQTGHYRFAFDVLGLREGDAIAVTAEAYRENGVRDTKQIGDAWVRADDPFDQRDRVIASDSVALSVYRSLVEIPIPGGDVALDLGGGRLELHRADGKVATIYHKTADGRGYEIAEPNSEGVSTIMYAPVADEINKSATTYVRFRVLDGSGTERVFDGHIPTP